MTRFRGLNKKSDGSDSISEGWEMAMNPMPDKKDLLPPGIPGGCSSIDLGDRGVCPGRGASEISKKTSVPVSISGKSSSKTKTHTPDPDPTSILDLDFFKCIPAGKQSSILSQALVRTYGKGEVLFSKGDPARYVWFVKEGYVKAVKYMSQGRCLTLCYMGAGGIFGTCCIFSEKNPYCKNCHKNSENAYPCNAIAESRATVVAIPLNLFNETVEKYPQLSRVMIGQLLERLKSAQETLSFSQESAERRVMRVLWRLTGEFGMEIPLTKKEISEMAGITVETCIRTIKILERRKLVEAHRGKFIIRNMQAVHPFQLEE